MPVPMVAQKTLPKAAARTHKASAKAAALPSLSTRPAGCRFFEISAASGKFRQPGKIGRIDNNAQSGIERPRCADSDAGNGRFLQELEWGGPTNRSPKITAAKRGGVIGCHRTRVWLVIRRSTHQTGSHFCTAHIHTDEGSVPATASCDWPPSPDRPIDEICGHPCLVDAILHHFHTKLS